MQIICKQNCRVPLCIHSCPIDAIIPAINTIYVDEKRCIGCGLCKVNCLFFSFDQALKEKTVRWLMGKG